MLAPPMKLSGRTRSTFVLFLLLGVLIGSLAWELLERILARFGLELGLSLGPVGFDLAVLAFSQVAYALACAPSCPRTARGQQALPDSVGERRPVRDLYREPSSRCP